MKINARQILKTLNGENIMAEPEKEFTVGIAIANMLSAGKGQGKNKFDPIKTWVLALDFYNKAEVEIDDADLIKLREVIESSDGTNLIKGQLLYIIWGPEKETEKETEKPAKK